MLSALRGVLKQCWRLGLMDADAYHRAAAVENVRASNLLSGRALAGEEIAKLFATCAADETVKGAELLQQALEHELGGDLDGVKETALRIADRLDALEATMDAACEHYDRLDDRLEHHQRQRDESAKQLYTDITRARQYFRGTMGAQAADAYLGLHGATPRDPKALRRISRIIAGRMADETWDEPKMDFVKDFQPQTAAKHMTDRARDLAESLDFLQDASPQVTVATAAKERAVAAFDSFHGKSARYLIAALELAGLDDLVAEIRNGVGRRGRPPKRKKLAEKAKAAQLTGAGQKALPAKRGDLLLSKMAESVEDPTGQDR
jgi:hypothetical protein